MIYTDGTHIVSDTGLQELHWFAERVGIAHFYFDRDRRCYVKPNHVSSSQLYAKDAVWSKRKVYEVLNSTK